jgi:phosphoglycolate phosphatase-like HAD superfamily hydrolase
MSSYEAVIFDQDGVLLDSGLNNFLWMDEVRKNAAEERGYSFETEDSIKVVKATSRQEIEGLLKEKDMTWNELREVEKTVERAKIEMIRQRYIRLFSGTKNLLHSLDVPVGLATNATDISTKFVLDFFSINSCFESVRTVELDQGRWFECKKPSDTLVEGVARDLGTKDVLMVGDSSSDIQAAKAADLDSVLVESYGEKPELNPTYRVKTVSEVSTVL